MADALTTEEVEALEQAWSTVWQGVPQAENSGSLWWEKMGEFVRAALVAVPRLRGEEREARLLNEIDYMCRVLERIQSSVPIKDGSWYAGVAMGVRARTGAAREEEGR